MSNTHGSNALQPKVNHQMCSLVTLNRLVWQVLGHYFIEVIEFLARNSELSSTSSFWICICGHELHFTEKLSRQKPSSLHAGRPSWKRTVTSMHHELLHI